MPRRITFLLFLLITVRTSTSLHRFHQNSAQDNSKYQEYLQKYLFHHDRLSYDPESNKKNSLGRFLNVMKKKELGKSKYGIHYPSKRNFNNIRNNNFDLDDDIYDELYNRALKAFVKIFLINPQTEDKYRDNVRNHFISDDYYDFIYSEPLMRSWMTDEDVNHNLELKDSELVEKGLDNILKTRDFEDINTNTLIERNNRVIDDLKRLKRREMKISATRKRLAHFLPKRYHWVDKGDIDKLGDYWFNGAQGKFAGPYRVPY